MSCPESDICHTQAKIDNIYQIIRRVDDYVYFHRDTDNPEQANVILGFNRKRALLEDRLDVLYKKLDSQIFGE